MESLAVERFDKFDDIFFPFVLDFLFLHPQVVIVLEVGVHDHLVQMPNYANMSVGLHIIVGPLIQFAFLHVHLGFVHYLQVQSVVLIEPFKFA